jgi:hypothetical protein
MFNFNAKPEKVFGKTWYRGGIIDKPPAPRIGGSQDYLISIQKSDERLFKSVVNDKNRWILLKEDEIMPLINDNNGFICEVLATYPKKLYFDIDGDSNLLLSQVKEIIYKYFGDNVKMAISGYENENKHSYHIVLPEYILKDLNDLDSMKKMIINMKKLECTCKNENCICPSSYFDDKVYTKNRPMKCINQSKPEKPKQMIIEDDNEKNHFINSFFSGNEIAYNFKVSENIPNQITPSNDLKELLNIVPLQLDKNFNRADLDDSKKLLMMLPNSKEISHSISWKVALFCENNGLSFSDFWEWAKVKNNTEERKNKWIMYWNKIVEQLDYKMSKKSFIMLLSFWYPELLEVERTSDYITKKFIDTLTIPSIEIDRITKDHFMTNHKVCIFNIGMGGGKTTMTVDYLKDTEKSFIWVTPRQALVMNTHQRFIDNKMSVINYLDCGASRAIRHKKINSASKLLLQCESLNYLDNTNQFDVLIIDEIETIIKSWDSETHDKNGDKNFNNFVQLFKNCKKIILLDAFTTATTLQFLEMLDINGIVTYSSKYKPSKKILNENFGYEHTINKIANELDDGKKLYIFHAYKSSTKNHYSIEELKSVLLEKCETKPRILVYHGDMSDEKKKTLYNVNEVWDKYDCILTTSSITVGVNYEGDNYDKVYLLISGCVNNVRDVIQTSMRIRKTKENIIEMFFFDRMEKSTLKYPHWYASLEDNLYKFLIDSSLNEKQSAFMDVFYKFCEMTNYDVGNVKKIVKFKLDKFENTLFESKMLIAYDDIPTIDDTIAKEIEREAVWVGKATQLDKFTLSRYYFDCHFYYMKDEERAFIWNNRCKNYFDNQKDDLVKKILKDNKVEKINQLHLNDLVISNDTSNYIKNNYASTIKNINQRIIKVLNQLFGCQIIEAVSKSKKSNATTYEFTDLFYELDEFTTKKQNNLQNIAFID